MKKFFYTKFFSSLKRDFSCLEIVFSFSFSSEAKSVYVDRCMVDDNN